MEVADQADFLNAAALFESTESPQEILGKLQAIESTLKKSVPYRYGPRTIDLDIVLMGSLVRKCDPTVPHPKLHQRRFVLEPLMDLDAGEIVHPVLHQKLRDYLIDLQDQHCEKTIMQL